MFSVAIAGELPRDQRLFDRLYGILDQVRGCLRDAGEPDGLRLAVSPLYAGGGWREWAQRTGCGVSGYLNADDAAWDGAFERTVRVEDPLRDALGEALCDQADLLLAVWNEDVTELSGATWELLRIALRKRMPCVWISAATGDVYWQEKTVYDTFEPDRLRRFVALIAGAAPGPERPSEKRVPLLWLGGALYRRYLKKYGANRRGLAGGRTDLLLREDFRLEGAFVGAEDARRLLLERYRAFDSAAIECNDRYQSALYWRAVLPLVASLFLALGFYAASVFAAIPVLSSTIWGIIAGVGFLLHGFVNLYVFMLSRSRRVDSYREGMVRNRQMAEMLRVLIHFVPFGAHLDLRRLCGEDRELYAALRKLAREAQDRTQTPRIARENAVEAFRHVREMLAEQIAYHRASEARYAAVTEHLKRWWRGLFYVGFALVLLRAGLQMFLSIPRFRPPELALGNGVKLGGFISSGANMLALLMPAWYSYFETKISLCNFRFNRDNHRRMRVILENEQDNFEHLCRVLDAAPAEALLAIGQSLAEIMTEKDTSMWARHYADTRIEHL